MLDIEFANQQSLCQIASDRLVSAARLVLSGEGVTDASISLAVVDDPTIHALNRQYLQHDYPTDVLSFLLDDNPDQMSGEVIVSSETAAKTSSAYGWSVQEELLLYVIHGLLHLVGYDDQTAADRRTMRERESHYLRQWGLVPRYDDNEEAMTPPFSAGGPRS